MARLTVIFEPAGDWPYLRVPDAVGQLGVRLAAMDVPENLDGLDVYDLARRLAELLLENLQAP